MGSTKDNCSFAFMTNNLLENINSPKDLKMLPISQLEQLASELRSFIIDVVSVKKGHLGASLGVVELTLALHRVFNAPDDQIVWDVGHQAYPHKILTGRRDVFHSNREFGGLAGFPLRSESAYDAFGTGHSSTSISAALGMAIASKLAGDIERQHIAVIGDASIASGMAFEGLNHAGVEDTNILVILNDNEMGIDPNVGALKDYLTSVKQGVDAHQKNLFEALNFSYSGPIDGHDIQSLISELERLKGKSGPKLLHVITTKGKGLSKAEQDQITYHAPGKFDKNSGDLIPDDNSHLPPKYQDVFGKTLVELAELNKNIIGITPAMPTGSSMKFMLDAFPDRAFDVGIAEQHAVTLAAGMATRGLLPFCSVYSTFLQRAYDQVIHDVAIQNLPVVFCIDRAGLVGEDGATHHGVFDIAYLRCIPNMTIAVPSDEIALRNLLYTVQKGIDGPWAIRYPRGRGVNKEWQQEMRSIEVGKAQQLIRGKKVAILGIGPLLHSIKGTLLDKQEQERPSLYDMCFVKPLDQALLSKIFQNYDHVITLEDGCLNGGFGSAILEAAEDLDSGVSIERLGVKDEFITHGSLDNLYQITGLDKESLLFRIERLMNSKNY